MRQRTAGWLLGGLIAAGAVVGGGCAHTVRVEPVEVRPIHLTVDLNIRVDRELDRFFDFERRLEPAEFDTAPGPMPDDQGGGA